MSSDFLGVGVKFQIQANGQHELATISREDDVRQSIWIIISTAPGERVMRPDFGCNIHELVFGLNSATTIGQITNEVKRALVRWEPRIDNIMVTAKFDVDQPNRLLVQVDYIVRQTNTPANLVYPFYLEPA